MIINLRNYRMNNGEFLVWIIEFYMLKKRFQLAFQSGNIREFLLNLFIQFGINRIIFFSNPNRIGHIGRKKMRKFLLDSLQIFRFIKCLIKTFYRKLYRN